MSWEEFQDDKKEIRHKYNKRINLQASLLSHAMATMLNTSMNSVRRAAWAAKNINASTPLQSINTATPLAAGTGWYEQEGKAPAPAIVAFRPAPAQTAHIQQAAQISRW